MEEPALLNTHVPTQGTLTQSFAKLGAGNALGSEASWLSSISSHRGVARG